MIIARENIDLFLEPRSVLSDGYNSFSSGRETGRPATPAAQAAPVLTGDRPANIFACSM